MKMLRGCMLWPAVLAAASALAQLPAWPAAAAAGDVADADPPVPATSGKVAEPPGGKRVLGVLPNYRTADASQEGTVLPARPKLIIASKDSFDYPLVALAAGLAGIGQMWNQQPSFGQGLQGYGHRVVTNYADQAIGNMFTEGVFPSLLHQDPRYFRRGSGTAKSRLGYALTRVLVTHKDFGGSQFNYSEWMGNASAVALSNTYYPDGRTLTNNATKLLFQVGTDAASQVLKEFWPDIRRKMFHKAD